jgi:hypothetical protein
MSLPEPRGGAAMPIVVTSISDLPRFVRMLLSTSWVHCEAVYKRAGFHTVSQGFSVTLRTRENVTSVTFLGDPARVYLFRDKSTGFPLSVQSG